MATFQEMRAREIDLEAECDRVMEFYKDQFELMSFMLDRQFRTLHGRAQVLLGICSLLLTATSIFRRLFEAELILLLGGALALVSAALLVGGVLHVRWITKQPGHSVRDWLRSTLRYRDRKTRVYRVATYLVLLCMVLFELSAVAAYLKARR
jgi:hypothetical protein